MIISDQVDVGSMPSKVIYQRSDRKAHISDCKVVNNESDTPLPPGQELGHLVIFHAD